MFDFLYRTMWSQKILFDQQLVNFSKAMGFLLFYI